MDAYRTPDDCIRRVDQGLRVLAKIARISLDNRELSDGFCRIGDEVRALYTDRIYSPAGLKTGPDRYGGVPETGPETRQMNLKDTARFNFSRVHQALQAMEKTVPAAGGCRTGEKIRKIVAALNSLDPDFPGLFQKRFPPGIYGILGEKFSLGRSNVDVAGQMVDAGVDILQYREKVKDKSFKQMLEECLEIREITRRAGVPFIVNDHAAIALLVEADGIHQGQDDLPVEAVRRLAPYMMIGCSTHSPQQAGKAVEDGADYIGVGPIFTTRTKEDVCDAVGLEYLEYVVRAHEIPFVAIGGIKRHNIRDVVKKGARTICLVTEIIGAKNIDHRIREIRKIIGETK